MVWHVSIWTCLAFVFLQTNNTPNNWLHCHLASKHSCQAAVASAPCGNRVCNTSLPLYAVVPFQHSQRGVSSFPAAWFFQRQWWHPLNSQPAPIGETRCSPPVATFTIFAIFGPTNPQQHHKNYGTPTLVASWKKQAKAHEPECPHVG